MPQAVLDVIERFAMLATMFYSLQNGSKVWLQENFTKSDNHYLAAQITSFIVLHVCSVTDSVLGHQLIFGFDFPTTRVILSRKRGRAVW